MLLVAFLVHIIIYTLQGSSTVHQYQQMPGLGSYQLANYHYKHCCRDCPSHWNIYVTIVLLEIRTLKTTFIFFFFLCGQESDRVIVIIHELQVQ